MVLYNVIIFSNLVTLGFFFCFEVWLCFLLDMDFLTLGEHLIIDLLELHRFAMTPNDFLIFYYMLLSFLAVDYFCDYKTIL